MADPRKMTKDEMRAETNAAMLRFAERGGQITGVGRSKRAFTGRELELMERGEKVALENLQRQRAEQQTDVAGRRAQRG